ncbi:MAG: hypothetical protein JWO67_4515 [Streptosporangiaceae bacterium]|nr:hypothetical protein [Streptosporangiaceae bacterium]
MSVRGKCTVGLSVLVAIALGVRGGRLLGELIAERRRARRFLGVAR